MAVTLLLLQARSNQTLNNNSVWDEQKQKTDDAVLEDIANNKDEAHIKTNIIKLHGSAVSDFTDYRVSN